jgi:hypothetical protein
MASYSRRDFLCSSLQLATACSVGATSTASMATSASYLAAAEGIWKPGIVRTDGVLDARELVRLATLAASSHNAQPWKFKIDRNTITIFPDFSRRLPSVDPDDSHLFKSLGCAAENLVHAASAQGYQASVAFDAKQDAVVIGLERSPAVTPSALFNAITARQCVRLEYDGKPVDGPQRDSIEYAARGEGIAPLLLTSKSQMDAMTDYVTQGNMAQFQDDDFVKELRDWVRFSNEEAIRSGDGLASAVNGQPSVPTWFGKTIFSLVTSGKKQADIDAKNIRSSAGIIAFVGERDDKANWVEAGRAYERFALQAASFGIRNAFINQPVEVRSLRSQLHASLNVTNKHVHLIARYGYGPTTLHSLRRPINDVIV